MVIFVVSVFRCNLVVNQSKSYYGTIVKKVTGLLPGHLYMFTRLKCMNGCMEWLIFKNKLLK
jgi:hypothetical protein